ncbi:phasin [Blastochloris sulfoviridis]|uniref:Phasin n=1 Tax=Blastochloris sulfoviridis TaxID=50712 RepID=A0A5M6HU84_9HYPH|nr:phasin [Blastochloris sulfoviridis]KAA5599237.1 phasin [Blastochloris sulfoviridis]
MAETKIEPKSMAEVKSAEVKPADTKPAKPKAPVAAAADMELPVAMREMAEKSVAQAKDAYEKIKSAAEETTDMIEDTYITASKGLSDLNIRALEAMRANINASFDFTRAVMQVKTLSQAVELTSSHIRKQFETLIDQTRELTDLAQKIAADTAEPVKASVEKVVKPAA